MKRSGRNNRVWLLAAMTAALAMARTALAATSPIDQATQSSAQHSIPYGIATGPDGNLWFTEGAGNGIGKLTPAGSLSQYRVPTADANPTGITAGPNQDMWFTESAASKIGRLTTKGEFTEFNTITPSSKPIGIALGKDGNLWFSESDGNQIGRITPDGTITEFLIPTAASEPGFIATGPDGNVWFPEAAGNKIGVISAAGNITEYDLPTPAAKPTAIAAGPDDNLWFTEFASNKIGKISTNGDITEYGISIADSKPIFITAGPDGNLWFSQVNGNRLGRITTDGEISEYTVPAGDSIPSGIAAGPDGNLWFTEFVGLPQWARFVQAIPKPVAVATPFLLLTLLAIATGRFLLQAYFEARKHRQIQALRHQQAIKNEERENFTNLIYHYFNTPLSLISGGYELMASQNLVSKDLADRQINITHQITQSSRQLMHKAQTQASPVEATKPWNFWPLIIGVAAIGLALGLSQWLYYRVGLVVPAESSLLLEVVLFVVLAQAAIFSRRNYVLSKRQTTMEQALYDQDLALINSRSEFLAGIVDAIGAQVVELEAGIQSLSPKLRINPLAESAINGVERLQSLLTRLSIMTQIVVIKQPNIEPIELSQTVKDIIISRSSEATAKHLQIDATIDPIQTVSLHGGYTASVISSLVDNAIKFSPMGGKVTISAASDAGQITLKIQDQGQGIDQDRLQELFQPFSRAGSTLEFNYEGVGLSLFFDKILLSKIGGSISLVSNPSTGTIVSLSLPRYANDREPGSLPAKLSPASATI